MSAINGNTRLSIIIRVNKDSIEAIASLSPQLQKLRNPILRKIMAPRVTLAEAAQFGGCTLVDIQQALAPLGFQWKEETRQPPPLVSAGAEPPGDSLVVFDVRPVLASSGDPLKAILEKFRALRNGESLCIINSFVPTPLIRLLEKEGASSSTTAAGPTEYRTYFKKEGRPAPSSDGVLVRMLTEDEFNKAYSRWMGRTREIDVRALESPLPMQTILAALDQLPRDQALYVFHKRIPVHLFELLEEGEKQYEINVLTLSERDVRLLITKN